MDEKKFDVQQVCENGHQITSHYNEWLEERKDFCEECGASTLTECPECKQEIQGAPLKYGHRKTLEDIVSIPKYCKNCGKPYPWTEKRIATAIKMFKESDKLNEEERKTIEQDIENISKEIPETELAALRIKKIWEKYGPIAYNLIMEFTSRTAAYILKNP